MNENILDKVDEVARYLWLKLKQLQDDFDEIVEIRGAGLLLGIKTKTDYIEISKIFVSNGLLTIPASDNIIRLAPPLIIRKNNVDEAVTIIRKVLKELNE